MSTFRRNISFSCYLLLSNYLLRLLLGPEDGGGEFFRDVSDVLPDHTVTYFTRQWFPFTGGLLDAKGGDLENCNECRSVKPFRDLVSNRAPTDS